MISISHKSVTHGFDFLNVNTFNFFLDSINQCQSLGQKTKIHRRRIDQTSKGWWNWENRVASRRSIKRSEERENLLRSEEAAKLGLLLLLSQSTIIKILSFFFILSSFSSFLSLDEQRRASCPITTYLSSFYIPTIPSTVMINLRFCHRDGLGLFFGDFLFFGKLINICIYGNNYLNFIVKKIRMKFWKFGCCMYLEKSMVKQRHGLVEFLSGSLLMWTVDNSLSLLFSGCFLNFLYLSTSGPLAYVCEYSLIWFLFKIWKVLIEQVWTI